MGIRIPKAIASELKLNDGTHVDLKYEEDKIVIYPIRKILLAEKLKK